MRIPGHEKLTFRGIPPHHIIKAASTKSYYIPGGPNLSLRGGALGPKLAETSVRTVSNNQIAGELTIAIFFLETELFWAFLGLDQPVRMRTFVLMFL